MFVHIFKYRIKYLLRDKATVFWTLMFPILLATFFNLALSDLNRHETFHAVDVAVVGDEQYQKDETFKTVLEEVSTGDDRLFNLEVVAKDEADRMLEDNEIAGYLLAGSPIKLIVNKSGIEQSIIRSFIDHYMQTVSTVTSILTRDQSAMQKLMQNLSNKTKYVKEVSGTNSKADNVMSYFYTLIAMACFYGGLQGSRDVSDIQANNTDTAARLNLAPVHKMKTFVYNMAASLLIHYSKMLVLLAYLTYALKVDFGSKTGYVLLTTFIGSIVGLSFGAFVSALLKKSEGVKVAILIGTSMFFSFLAGMMFQGMKYIIAQKLPILSYLNPLNLLTDAYYSLYYYDTYSRYTGNMLCLTAFVLIFCYGTYLIIRRRKYASL